MTELALDKQTLNKSFPKLLKSKVRIVLHLKRPINVQEFPEI